MGLAARSFLLSDDETLHAFAGTALMRMLRQEAVSRLPDFAGRRVRLASIVVEMKSRKPLRVVHRTFSILVLGADGLLDLALLNTQQAARLDDMLSSVAAPSPAGARVVNAASRFIARGGSWDPDDRLMRNIDAAALGILSCGRVRVVR